MQAQARQQARPARPWWRYGMVWMVIGGPLVVVVAGIATAVIAFRGADPVVRPAPAQVAAEEAFDLQPAMAGRNHAATGSVPAPR
ncbi:nitrogen fixation protein FixH [Pseudorhodoferax soli]|uniref:Nitrogen fixation protein FixH n=1 Tax=Pseudorhodoferax soli TaxID=545864 RepID=A0A368XMG5_9BURK|nr:nitrogen fixation protein FixH [Pseudorhodoferax soli]RCW68228.1 hypothetical protein DES41_108411 [Pseudorhodoferax soli]